MLPLLMMLGRGVLHAEHDAAEQGRHRRIETVDLEALDAAGLRRSAGIVEQAIDLAELVHRKRDQRLHLRLDGHVGLTKDAGGAELGCECLAFGHAPTRDDDLRALGHEDFRRAQSDAAGGPRDHRDLAVQSCHVLFLSW
jgi:hypothetical protein